MSDPSGSRTFIRVFLFTFLGLMLLTGIILLFTWLFLRPSLPYVTVTTLSLSNFNTSNQGITGTWRLGFTLHNGNKKTTITYNKFRTTLSYHSKFIAKIALDQFKQRERSKLTLSAATLSANNAYFEPRAVTDLNGDRSKGSVQFDIQTSVDTEFRAGLWKFRKPTSLQIFCKNIPIGISSNATSGELVGGPKGCQVKD
jgi:hypothetical protein